MSQDNGIWNMSWPTVSYEENSWNLTQLIIREDFGISVCHKSFKLYVYNLCCFIGTAENRWCVDDVWKKDDKSETSDSEASKTSANSDTWACHSSSAAPKWNLGSFSQSSWENKQQGIQEGQHIAKGIHDWSSIGSVEQFLPWAVHNYLGDKAIHCHYTESFNHIHRNLPK